MTSYRYKMYEERRKKDRQMQRYADLHWLWSLVSDLWATENWFIQRKSIFFLKYVINKVFLSYIKSGTFSRFQINNFIEHVAGPVMKLPYSPQDQVAFPRRRKALSSQANTGVYNSPLCVQCSVGWRGSQIWTIIILLYWQMEQEKQLCQIKDENRQKMH